MRFEINAASEDGLSGEGPFFYTADSPEAARQMYIDWALTQHGPAFAGPGLPVAELFPVIRVDVAPGP